MNTKNNIHSLKGLTTFENKGTDYLINLIRYKLTEKTRLPFSELKRKYSEKELYKIGLNYFITSNGTICKALNISQDSGALTREELIKDGLLKVTPTKHLCHYYNKLTFFYTTNPALFEFVENFKYDK